ADDVAAHDRGALAGAVVSGEVGPVAPVGGLQFDVDDDEIFLAFVGAGVGASAVAPVGVAPEAVAAADRGVVVGGPQVGLGVLEHHRRFPERVALCPAVEVDRAGVHVLGDAVGHADLAGPAVAAAGGAGRLGSHGRPGQEHTRGHYPEVTRHGGSLLGRAAPMGLFETTTIPARQVLAAATGTAAAMGSHEVEAAHLLVGLLDTPSTVQPAIAAQVADREGLVCEVQRVTLPAARPAFGAEVCEVLAAARGISAGRGVAVTGTAALAQGLLLLLPHSVEELLRRRGVNLDNFRQAVAVVAVDDGEATENPDAPPWAVRIASGPDTWSEGP